MPSKTLFSVWFGLLVLLLATPLAWAQMPKAIVTGPKEASLGDMVCLDASQSEGTQRLWLLAVSPVPKSFMPVDQGLRCVFATGTPGRYVFVLVAAGSNPNGGPAVDMTTHEIVIKGSGPDVPPPPVVPPVPPDPPTPPVNAGRRLCVILRETESTDTVTATAVLQLRTDQQILDRLQAKNHPPPLILDKDSAVPLVARLLREAGSERLPLLYVLDYSAGVEGSTLLRAPMPATAAGVLDSLIKVGG